jgi:16S rRNA processing protein RimM
MTGGDEVPLLEIGRIGRAHGLGGEVAVHLSTNIEGRLAPGAEMLAGDEPVVVVSSRRHQQRWLVRFEGRDDRASAERLTGRILSAPAAADPDDPEAVYVHQLVGANVVDSGGHVYGVVVEVIENPASDLLSLDVGALVPLTFVDTVGDGTIVLAPDLPDGLFDG